MKDMQADIQIVNVLVVAGMALTANKTITEPWLIFVLV
jgi:hypothetical protein